MPLRPLNGEIASQSGLGGYDVSRWWGYDIRSRELFRRHRQGLWRDYSG